MSYYLFGASLCWDIVLSEDRAQNYKASNVLRFGTMFLLDRFKFIARKLPTCSSEQGIGS